LNISVGVRTDKFDTIDLFLWTSGVFADICIHIWIGLKCFQRNFLKINHSRIAHIWVKNVVYGVLWVFVQISWGVRVDYKRDAGCSCWEGWFFNLCWRFFFTIAYIKWVFVGVRGYSSRRCGCSYGWLICDLTKLGVRAVRVN
jgi:hypothetical protein